MVEKIILALIFLCAIVYLVRKFTKNVRGDGCGCGDGCGNCCSMEKKSDCHEKRD